MSLPSLDAENHFACGGAGSQNVSYSLAIGANAKLVVVAIMSTITSNPFTGVTVGGQACTLLGRQAVGSMYGVALYYKTNPPTGTQTIAIAAGATYWRGGSIARSYLDADTTTPFGTPQSVSVSGQTSMETGSISSAAGELIIDAAFTNNGDNTSNFNPTSPQSENPTDFVGSGGAGANSARISGSSKEGSASTTMKWTWTYSTAGGCYAVPVKPTSGPPAISGTASGTSAASTASGSGTVIVQQPGGGGAYLLLGGGPHQRLARPLATRWQRRTYAGADA